MGGRTWPQELPGPLVETHYRTLRIVLRLDEVQHVLHPRHELPAHLGDTGLFLLPGHLSSWPFEYLAHRLAGRCSRQTPTPPTGVGQQLAQCVMPFGRGGAREADQVRFLLAVQLAVLAIRPRSVIDGGLKSFLHVPAALGDRGRVGVSLLTVPKHLVSLEQRQRVQRFTQCALNGLPRWDTSLRRERSASVEL